MEGGVTHEISHVRVLSLLSRVSLLFHVSRLCSLARSLARSLGLFSLCLFSLALSRSHSFSSLSLAQSLALSILSLSHSLRDTNSPKPWRESPKRFNQLTWLPIQAQVRFAEPRGGNPTRFKVMLDTTCKVCSASLGRKTPLATTESTKLR